MKYLAPFGSTDPNASYVDKNTPGAVRGSAVPGRAIEDPQRELDDLISKSGLTPTEAVLQLAKAIQTGKITYAVAAGTANAMTATLVPAPDNLASIVGSLFRLRTGASANGAGGVTLNLNGFGALAVTKLDSTPLLAGDLPANSIAEFSYTGTAFMLMSAGSPNKPVVNGVALYSTAGTFSWVCPAGVTKVRAKIWGGGGGGGGSGTAAGSAATSAGGAGYAEKVLDVVPGTSYAVVVGAGGTAGPGGGSPAAGGTGGTSSFGGVLSATGGTGGVAANGAPQTATGAGGAGSGGDLNVPGGGGGVAYQIGSNYLMPSGGYSFQTSVNQPVLTGALIAGRQGAFPGGGGGGGFLGGAGGVGGGGLVILEF